MKIVILTKHKDVYTGSMFSIAHIIETTSPKIDYKVANSDMGGDGLCEEDKENLFEYLRSVGNIHSISVELCH